MLQGKLRSGESMHVEELDPTRIQQLIPELYAVVAELEAAAPGRSFAPDGHLLGSIGEVIAAARYGLELTTASTKGIDAHTSTGQPVEIKCTGGGGSIALRGEVPVTDELHLLVLTIAKDGMATTIYNGPAAPVWAAAGRVQSNGQRKISLSELKRQQLQVPDGERLVDVES